MSVASHGSCCPIWDVLAGGGRGGSCRRKGKREKLVQLGLIWFPVWTDSVGSLLFDRLGGMNHPSAQYHHPVWVFGYLLPRETESI